MLAGIAETGTFREVEQSNVGLAVLTDKNLWKGGSSSAGCQGDGSSHASL